MPKPFSESERTYIKTRLIEAARECMIRYGIRKTTVDEIVRRVGIPKGTFYLFYETKEHLLFDVFRELHDEYQGKIMSEIAAIEGDIHAENLTDLLYRMYQDLDRSEMARLMSEGEVEYLFRKLPPELNQLHAEQDDFRIEELITMVPNININKISAYRAALRGVFMSLIHKKDVGEDVFDEALRIMIRGVVIQMFEGDRK